MKYCPICQTRFDEEIMRFCTKDGTPLIDEEEPHFVEMPSESVEIVAEEEDEATVIRRRNPVSEAPVEQPVEGDQQRLIVPVVDEREEQQQVRTKTAAYRQSPQKSNTALVVLATMLGTIFVLGGALGAYWLLSGQNVEGNLNANKAFNSNQDTNLNTNLPVDNSMFDFNANTKVNVNTNANVKTPTPTPTRTPTPTPTPTPRDDNANINSNTSNTNANTRPTVTPTPSRTPTPPPSNTPVNIGNMNSRAISLPKPVYPPVARTMRASGQVVVQVLVDESGKVVSANALSGHPLLRQAAESAARSSRFNPVRISGQAVKSAGTVVYNFVDN